MKPIVIFKTSPLLFQSSSVEMPPAVAQIFCLIVAANTTFQVQPHFVTVESEK